MKNFRINTLVHLIVITLFFTFSCNSIQEKDKIIHKYGSISFYTSEKWIDYPDNNKVITLIKEKNDNDNTEFITNLTILFYKADSTNENLSTVNIAINNIKELDNICLGYDVIIFQEFPTDNYLGIEVGIALQIEKGVDIGTLFYVFKNEQNDIVIMTFQGSNQKGQFRFMIEEFRDIAKTIQF